MRCHRRNETSAHSDLCPLSYRGRNLVRVQGSETRSYWIDDAVIRESAHGAIMCTGCHIDFAYKAPHNIEQTDWVRTARLSCKNCHQEQWNDYSAGAHSLAVQPGEEVNNDYYVRNANPTLRTMYQKARDNSVPLDTIERAVKRGTGELEGVSYESITYDVPTVAVNGQLVTSVDQPEELIYQITQALWNDNTRKLLDNGHAKGKVITLDTALVSVLIPLHPGAEKFYREQGLIK